MHAVFSNTQSRALLQTGLGPDVHPVIRPKWNTNSDEEREKQDVKKETQRRTNL
jgi:hypothetical protein